MGAGPTVSVVICFLDAERFLGEAIKSVIAQTYWDWELLLVDDGSQDGSAKIARRTASTLPGQVHLLEHPGHHNRGISVSRNLGLSQAQGRYVAFLDADDIWSPDKLEIQVALLDANPGVAMTYGPMMRWYGWTARRAHALRDTLDPQGLPHRAVVEPPDLLTMQLRSGGRTVPGIGSLLIRRDVIEEVGGFEEAFGGVFEDQVFGAKVLLRHRVLVTDHCTLWYRQHEASCCAEAIRTGDYHPVLPSRGRGRYLSWLQDYVSERDGSDPRLQRALRQQLRPYGEGISGRLWNGLPRLRRKLKQGLRTVVRVALPAPVFAWLRGRTTGRPYVPPPGWVRFGSLRRLDPISSKFGFDRGLPLDRHYIEQFLAIHASDIRGCVLEIGDNAYTRKYGGERVTRSEVLNISPDVEGTTLVADLSDGQSLASEMFDCIILTQTLQWIYDLPAAMETLRRILKPGGVVLATVPGTTQVDDEWTWYWGFTEHSVRQLFESAFPHTTVEVRSHGNVLVATCFLHGISTEELLSEETDYDDPAYPVLITVRAVRLANPDSHSAAANDGLTA